MSDQGFEHFSGTMPVSQRQQFDVGALEAWMKANVHGFNGPLTVEQFKGGQSNPTFKLFTHAFQTRAGGEIAALRACH